MLGSVFLTLDLDFCAQIDFIACLVSLGTKQRRERRPVIQFGSARVAIGITRIASFLTVEFEGLSSFRSGFGWVETRIVRTEGSNFGFIVGEGVLFKTIYSFKFFGCSLRSSVARPKARQ